MAYEQHIYHTGPERLVRQFHFIGLLGNEGELLEVGYLDEAGTDNGVKDAPYLLVLEVNQLADSVHVLDQGGDVLGKKLVAGVGLQLANQTVHLNDALKFLLRVSYLVRS